MNNLKLYVNEKGFSFGGSMNKILFDGYYKVFKEEEELNLEDFPKIEVGIN